jgi:putative protein kinase ArgK-like GTPase of G3E family
MWCVWRYALMLLISGMSDDVQMKAGLMEIGVFVLNKSIATARNA